MIIEEIVGLAILGFFIAEWFQPIQFVKNKLELYKYWWGKHLFCVKCCSFWLGLAVTLNLYQAAIISVLAYVISYIIDKLDRDRYGN
jgi:hypothetical protein